MDLRQLRYFIAVAEELSFTVAAQRLNISQPPLSMQIKALEESLGTLLFDRTHRNIRLTEAGEVLLNQARGTVSQLAHAIDLTQRAGRGETGLLRVAFTGSVPLVSAFATLVRAFRREWPQARLEIVHMPTGRQLEALAERRIDVGLLRPSHFFVPPAHLDLEVFHRDELRLVLPCGHPLATAGRPVPMSALRTESFVLFPRSIGCGLQDHVLGLCTNAGFVPKLVQEALEGTTIIGLVAAGVGVSLLPDSYSKVDTGSVVYARLADAGAASQVLMAHRSDGASQLQKRFIALAMELQAPGRTQRRRKAVSSAR